MATLTPDQINDLAVNTLKVWKVGKWTDLSLEFPEYVWSSMVDAKNVIEEGGPAISYNIQVANTSQARAFGPFSSDHTDAGDVMVTATLPWSGRSVNWSYDDYEAMFQGDRETIIKQMVIREHQAKNAMAEQNEEDLWSAPTATTENRMMGIPFWMQKPSSASTGAFSGGNPSGFSAGAAGISSTTYPRWRNWTFSYVQYSVDDLVVKTKKAMFNTRFMPPVPHPELGYGKADYQIFTTLRVTEPLERLAETRNDNLGSDLARYVGQVTIGGVPMKAVPYLETNDTSDPLYGVNWKELRPYVLRGANMRRVGPVPAPRQHSTKNVFIDVFRNMGCYNRRALWVGCKV